VEKEKKRERGKHPSLPVCSGILEKGGRKKGRGGRENIHSVELPPRLAIPRNKKKKERRRKRKRGEGQGKKKERYFPFIYLIACRRT